MLAKRLSNLDLLRYIAMLFIIVGHCTGHGVFPFWGKNLTSLDTFNNAASLFLCSFGKIGVTIFVFISGYFLSEGIFHLKKLIYIYLETLFYSLLFALIWYFVNPALVKDTILFTLFPISKYTYWFITVYLLLYIFSPLLNCILDHLDRKAIRFYLGIMTILWLVCPTFWDLYFECSTLIYFCYIYLLSAAVRKGYISINIKYCVLILSLLLLRIFFLEKPFFKVDNLRLGELERFFGFINAYIFFFALIVFEYFRRLDFQNKIVNYFSGCILGVYLIHDNMFVRPWIWNEILHVVDKMNSNLFVLWVFLFSILVLIGCIGLDKILSIAYKPIFNYVGLKIETLLYNRVNREDKPIDDKKIYRFLSFVLIIIVAYIASPLPYKLAIYGDSLSAVSYLKSQELFSTKLEKALRDKGYFIEIINASLGGETTIGGLARQNQLLSQNPDGVLLELGFNDISQNYEISDIKRNLETLIKNFQEKKVQVLLSGMRAPLHQNHNNENFKAMYQTIADENHLIFYPFHMNAIFSGEDTFDNPNPLLLPDAVHPNADGVSLMVQDILPTVEKFLNSQGIFAH